ncbi:hypothetical protein EDD29_8275 [Actinocorallia herbida]|uniref:Uncharacterized protein n=1 Tax=Actinocorallia herbida TaxID=58109 RepID=A0A3N1DAL2_9ACTN|nr:hypothetical protein [Actinocorallia herbida]ROO90544.1 hypothetical protein EDD29_8275 [Actinocorallia herbida]
MTASEPALHLEVHGPVDTAVQVGRLVLRLPAPFPDHPPSRAARGTELAALWRAASEAEPPPGVVLTGPSGSGKSTLALQWAHQAHGLFPGGLRHADLCAAPAPAPTDPPEGPRSLLILDNVPDDFDVVAHLPAAESCFTLITTRVPRPSLIVDGFRALAVTPPPPPSAPLLTLLHDLPHLADPAGLPSDALTPLLRAAQAEAEDTRDLRTHAAVSLRLARLDAEADRPASALHSYAQALHSYAHLGDTSSYALALREATHLHSSLPKDPNRPSPPEGTARRPAQDSGTM